MTRGIILAGGLGTRLYPLTYATNKHLLPVYNQPMIYYPIQTLVRAGIKDILIVVSGPHSGDFINVLQNGDDFGVKNIQYAYQESGTGGIADALRLGRDFAAGESVAVILGDNCTDADISSDVKNFRDGAHIFVRSVPDPERFGIAEIEAGRVISVEEKPSLPKSSLAITGLYLYDETVFDKIEQTEPSERGQYEITAVNDLYLREGRLTASVLEGFWSDAGTFDSLIEVNNYWKGKNK